MSNNVPVLLTTSRVTTTPKWTQLSTRPQREGGEDEGLQNAQKAFLKVFYYITEWTFSNHFIAKKRSKKPFIIHLPMACGKEERRSRVSISY